MPSIWWYFPVSALVNAVTSGILAGYILLTNFKQRLARHLFYFCLSVACWSFGYFFWQISATAESALLWSRILMIGAIFTSNTYLHLVFVFLNIDQQKFYKRIILVFYGFSLLWATINLLTPFFVSGVQPILFFKFWPIAGPFYTPFLVGFGAHVVYASILLFKKYRVSQGAEKKQTLFLLFGIILAFVGGSTNFPLWYGVEIVPWGNGLVTVYVVLTVYAMMKYKFLGIRAIFAEFFTAVLFGTMIVDAFLSRQRSEAEFYLRFGAALLVGLFGIILVRSILKVVEQQEKVLSLAQSLKDSNAELEHTNTQLKELDRQKTEFLTIAAHQLRTPLSIIKGYISLLEDGTYGKLKHEVKVVLHNMDDSNQWLIRLADEFLNIARLEQGRTKYVFAPKNISDIVEGVVKELGAKATAKPGLSLAFKKPHTQIVAEIDEEKIRYAIYNYVDNAIKYSEKGVITISAEVENDGVSVRVTDKGLGFDSHDEANFFQKFYRGENVHTTNVNGTGLGLYVCSKFIKGHHGKIWAHSPGLGKGSEFGFWIPKIAPPAAHTGDSDVSTNIPLIESVQS